MSGRIVGDSRARLLAVVTGLLLAVSCTQPASHFKPEGARFSVGVPGEVTCGAWKIDPDGVAIRGRTCTTEIRGSLLTSRNPLQLNISWARLPAGQGPTETFEAIRRDEMTLVPAPRDSKETLATLGGVEAVEFEAISQSGVQPQIRITARSRYAVKDGWLYCIRIVGALDTAAERTWADVVGSFTFEG